MVESRLRESVAASPRSSGLATAALIDGQARAAARQSSNAAAENILDPAAARASVQSAVERSLSRSSSTVVEIELQELGLQSALSLLADGNSKALRAELSESVVPATASSVYWHNLEEGSLVYAQLQKATRDAQAAQGKALQDLTSRTTARQKLESEPAARDAEVKEITDR